MALPDKPQRELEVFIHVSAFDSHALKRALRKILEEMDKQSLPSIEGVLGFPVEAEFSVQVKRGLKRADYKNALREWFYLKDEEKGDPDE